MFRFRFVRLALRMEFPDRMLKAWAKHAPCQTYECDICNPIVDQEAKLW